MQKYHVTIEFRRYKEVNGIEEYFNKTITIGVFDDFKEACLRGNKELENLENRFKIHVFPSGKVANKERFSLNGGCFGSKKTLITNLAYLQTPFNFYAKITTLNYSNDINDVIDKILN